MSDGNPPDDMFGGLPFMADLMKLLQGQTSGSNDTARQLAHTIANDGQSEPNIDPADRIAVEQLIRVAELQVASLTELSTGPSRSRSGTGHSGPIARSPTTDHSSKPSPTR